MAINISVQYNGRLLPGIILLAQPTTLLFSERAVWGVGEYAARLLLLFFFPCSADHERDWLPCKTVFSGWQPIFAY